MKRAIGILLTSVLVFAGCSSNPVNEVKPDQKTNPNVSANASKVKIKVWTINRHDQEYFNTAVSKFNKENKDNIEVEYSIFSDNFNQALDLALSTGEGPDIFIDGNQAYFNHLPKGNIAPLDKFLTPEYKKRFGEGAFLDGINTADGKIYSLPAVGTTPRLIYNKGIFEKAGIQSPPKSLDEMVAAAKQITAKLKGEGIYGFAMPLKSPLSAFSRSFDFTLERSGGPVMFGYDFKNGKYDFSQYKPILNAWKEIFNTGVAFPGSDSLDIDPLRTQFAAGKIGMYISWIHSEPGVYQNQFPTKENWDVAQLPTIDGTVKGAQYISQAGRWFMINAKSQHQDQAWKVMELLYSDEFLAGYNEKGLGMVILPSVIEKGVKPETIKKWPNLAFTDKDKVWPSAPVGVKPEGNDMYFIFSKIVFGALDVDKGIQDLNQRYNTAMDKAVNEGKVKRIQYPNIDPLNPGKVFEK